MNEPEQNSSHENSETLQEKLKEKNFLLSQEISVFCTQLYMIIKSGISITEGIGIMSEDSHTAFAKKVLTTIHEELEMGMPLHLALSKTSKFPEYVVTMVEIGESTGKLEAVMLSLSNYYERETKIKRVIRSAVTYPLVMIAIMVVVISILVVQVMPIFSDVFTSLGAQLTGFPLIVMNFGQTLGNYSIIIISVIAVIAATIVTLFNTKSGFNYINKLKETFFLTRKLYAKISSGRFASAMSLMLASGMDTDQSLDMVYKLIKTPLIRRKIEVCKKQLENGASFAEALSESSLFTGIYSRMTTVAFKTGTLDTIMEKIATQYEEETNSQIDNVISLIEPSLVALLSIIVGIILLSVMFPLMGIMAAIS